MRRGHFYPRFYPSFHESPAHPATFAVKAVWCTRIMAQTFARPLVGSALAVAHAARVRHLQDRVRQAHAPLEYRSARRSVQRAFYAALADQGFNQALAGFVLGFCSVAGFTSRFKTVCHSAVVRPRLNSRQPKTHATAAVLASPMNPLVARRPAISSPKRSTGLTLRLYNPRVARFLEGNA